MFYAAWGVRMAEVEVVFKGGSVHGVDVEFDIIFK